MIEEGGVKERVHFALCDADDKYCINVNRKKGRKSNGEANHK